MAEVASPLLNFTSMGGISIVVIIGNFKLFNLISLDF